MHLNFSIIVLVDGTSLGQWHENSQFFGFDKLGGRVPTLVAPDQLAALAFQDQPSKNYNNWLRMSNCVTQQTAGPAVTSFLFEIPLYLLAPVLEHKFIPPNIKYHLQCQTNSNITMDGFRGTAAVLAVPSSNFNVTEMTLNVCYYIGHIPASLSYSYDFQELYSFQQNNNQNTYQVDVPANTTLLSIFFTPQSSYPVDMGVPAVTLSTAITAAQFVPTELDAIQLVQSMYIVVNGITYPPSFPQYSVGTDTASSANVPALPSREVKQGNGDLLKSYHDYLTFSNSKLSRESPPLKSFAQWKNSPVWLYDVTGSTNSTGTVGVTIYITPPTGLTQSALFPSNINLVASRTKNLTIEYDSSGIVSNLDTFELS